MNRLPKVENVPCNLCQAQDCEPRFVKGGLSISRCRRCNLIYANPRLTQEEIWQRYSPGYFWDEYMPAHHAPRGEFDVALHQQRSQPLLDLLQTYQEPGTLLEVGCAAGFFLKIAEANGWSVQGVEIMKPAVEYAGSTLHINVFEGTLEEAQFAANSFDAVALIETIEHLLDPAAVLREVHRILKPGGSVLLTTPNVNSMMLPLLGVDWSVLSPAEHLFYFTEQTMGQMLQQAGFHAVQFFWRLPQQTIWETMNPLNTHRPYSWRSRLVKWGVLAMGRFIVPFAVKYKRSDRLTVLAVK